MNKDEQKKNNGDNDDVVVLDINGSNDEINIRQNEQKGIFDSNVKLDFSFQGQNKINMKITKEMVIELNIELANKGCSFRYEFDEDGFTGNPHIKITPPSMNYVSSFIINPTREFFNWLELWFKTKGIELSYNNDGSILWSKTGWNEE